jgi:formamidopyrimidine-DNA glycosylase
MPELAEVEFWRTQAESHCKGQKIVEAFNVRDEIVLQDELFEIDVFKRELEGRRVQEVIRRGKYLWWKLDNDKCLCFHFAMSGNLAVHGHLGLSSGGFKEFQVNDDLWPPKFAKCWFTFENGTKIAFVNVRRFGRVRLVNQIEEIK